jgi:DNA-binding NarL/FixJ family response regulator
MSQQTLAQIPVLLVTNPGRIRDGLRALLRTIPEIGTIYQATDGSSAAQIITKNHPVLVLWESKLFENDMTRISNLIKTMPPETRCILLIDNLRRQPMAELTGADTVLLSGFSAWDFLVTVEKLLPQKTTCSDDLAKG